MIPDPMVRLREMAPLWARWVVVEDDGDVWWQAEAIPSGLEACHFDSWHGACYTTEFRDTRRDNPFALNLRTGAAKFPDGTTIPARVWMRFYRKRIGAQP